MCIGIAISVSAIGGYVTTLWPGAPGKIIAIAVTVLIFVLNISPIKAISKAQSLMFYLLCAATAAYIVYGLFNINLDALDFSAGNYFAGGSRGFIQATTTFCVTTGFYVQVYALASQAKNPRKHMPKSMLITAIMILILYPLMTFVNVNTLPWENTVGQTMVGTAKALLPTGLFIFFIICGPILATATTLNAGFLGLSKPFASAAEAGWLPRAVGQKNRHNAPVITLAILLAAAVIPYLFTDNVGVIANQTVLVQTLIKLFPLVAAWKIPTKFPEYWKTGLFRKMPLPLFYVLMGFCTIVQLSLFVSSMLNLTTMQVFIGLGLFVVLTVVAIIWSALNGKKIDVSVDYESMS
jgi:APA family basic amino acid/polyamine antiporter